AHRRVCLASFLPHPSSSRSTSTLFCSPGPRKMQFRVLALLVLAATASARVVQRHAGEPASPQPSAGSPWYGCPEYSRSNHGQVYEQCDRPPHSGTLFGCTYRTGKGTGTHSCTYNSRTGAHVGGNSQCPSSATPTYSYKKRDTDL
ncbi:hypothetical protein B0H15DRAFT_996494, partial [Mycena belliarum]